MEIFKARPQLLCCLRRCIPTTQRIISRNRSQNKAELKDNTHRALEYFDVSYKTTYGSEWPSIRLGLLSKHKYFAIVNNYSPSFMNNVEKFKDLGCMDVGARYRSNVQQLQEARQAAGFEDASGREQDSIEDGDEARQSYDRPPVRDMDADQLGEHFSQPSPGRYPEQYRERQDSVGEGDRDLLQDAPGPDRVLLPQAGPFSADAIKMQVPHDYVPSSSLKGLENLVEEGDVFQQYKLPSRTGEGPGVSIKPTTEFLQWPEMLTVMGFPQGDISNFPKPRKNHGLYDHFALDGSSLLPVLLLGVQPGDSVLDMCAAPGGKTLALLQTCLTGLLISNDSSLSRSRRIDDILRQFYSTESPMLKTHTTTQVDGRSMIPKHHNQFDRVLVDAPCLNDRHSLRESDNSIFATARLKERLGMPEIQAQLIVSALQLVRVGGSVVYSTCSLSPLQNDGAVHLALHTLWDHTNVRCDVIDYSQILEPFDMVFKFGRELGLKYGQIVVPWLPNNYGPMYCAKFVRTR